MRATFPLILLMACEPISLGGGDAGAGVGSADDVTKLCTEHKPQSTKIDLSFDEYSGGCPWGEGDNLSEQDGYFTARVEDTEKLGMSSDSVICDVDYDFQVDPDQTQVMQYDDHFLLTFVDSVIATSNAQLVDLLGEGDDGHVPWDWAKVGGEAIDWNNADSWCLGQADGLADCTIPPTETPGEMTLDFDPTIVAKLSYRAQQLNRVDFTFITIGDNDPETDCSHNAFGFQVNVSYVDP